MFYFLLNIVGTVVFIGLLIGILKLTFKVTWGFAKILSILLSILAIPIFILCLVFAKGLLLLLPIGMVIAVFCFLIPRTT